MQNRISRRRALGSLLAAIPAAVAWNRLGGQACAAGRDPRFQKSADAGLKWVARTQSRLGHWTAGNYPTAMTALAGTALLGSGSTTVQGPYARNIRRAVDYLMSKCRPNGLIGDPRSDNRYTYGHGFSMLFLSQVLGEEEDVERREELFEVLNRAVKFSGQAQTKSGGWGYISAADGNDFDEGSTTITQVQGLRGCRNAGIPVPKEIIDKARKYIYQCQNDSDGGISYSSRNRGSSRPAITAAALASLYNAGDYQGADPEHSEKIARMSEYCRKNLFRITDGARSFGHWHYTYLYYSQVVYRESAPADKRNDWEEFSSRLYNKIVGEQTGDGSWQGNIGPIYVTSCNLIMLQLDYGYLPIYQR
jgi:hypothetical protein